MTTKILNSNHELDLNLIQQFGAPEQIPEGEDLSKKDFLTPEKINFFGNMALELGLMKL